MPQQPQTSKPGYAIVAKPVPKAIVVHCSDPGLQLAFEKFIEHELGLAKGDYVPIIVGGGAGVLAHPEQLPKEFKFLRDRFEFYRELFPSVKRVVLINHEDCHYYGSLKEKVAGFLAKSWQAVAHPSRIDLSLVSRAFASLLSHLGMSVEFYYGKFADAERTRMIFEKVGV